MRRPIVPVKFLTCPLALKILKSHSSSPVAKEKEFATIRDSSDAENPINNYRTRKDSD